MLQIRDAVPADIPIMMNIYNEAVRNSTVTFDLEEKTLADRQAWFAGYGKDYPLIVAEFTGEVVGYCSLSRFRERAAYASTAELSIYIAIPHQGIGVGSKLMSEIIDRGTKRGFHTVVSGINNGNQASIKLHEKFGFQHVGHLREVGRKFGEWLDVFYYQRMLQSDS
jgi:L-amino acid N-acyltransferase